jgi:hypothetical protein
MAGQQPDIPPSEGQQVIEAGRRERVPVGLGHDGVSPEPVEGAAELPPGASRRHVGIVWVVVLDEDHGAARGASAPDQEVDVGDHLIDVGAIAQGRDGP